MRVFYDMDGLLVVLWVDDFLYGGTDAAGRKFEQYLLDKSGCDQPEDAHHFCGITISQTLVNGKLQVTMDQGLKRVSRLDGPGLILASERFPIIL